MKDKLPNLFEQLIFMILPYIVAGIVIACTIGLFILFYYVVIWGIVIGAMLWLIAFIRRQFFKKSVPIRKGRVIDHEKNNER